jgi:hypothetical protein
LLGRAWPNANEKPFGTTFPYVALSNGVAVNQS